MTATEAHQAIESVFRIERARLIGGIARMVHDLALAEDLAQDALVAALDRWPGSGVPHNPGAWLMAVAKRRAIDRLRHQKMRSRRLAEIGHEPAELVPEVEAALDDDLGDEVLALIFAACHPVLAPEAQVALTLRLVGGLSTAEIARAFLTRETTIAQRIVRAKQALRRACLRFEVPRGLERAPRLSSVLAVIYLIFNEGYSATAGPDLIRPALCAEALRLGRILAQALPDEAEVAGLLALMELQASRLRARTDAHGAAVPLPEQNRAQWDWLLIRRGLAGLARAEALGGAPGDCARGAGGPYALQAALAACHANARRPEATDWHRIAALYDALRAVQPSPVVDLNRAVAHGMAFGAATGLSLLAEVEAEALLRHYAPFHAAKGDLLARAGHRDMARAAFVQAATLSHNERERAFLLARAAACGP